MQKQKQAKKKYCELLVCHDILVVTFALYPNRINDLVHNTLQELKTNKTEAHQPTGWLLQVHHHQRRISPCFTINLIKTFNCSYTFDFS